MNIDEGKFRQVIMNFADNAIYYSHDDSKIDVKLSVEGSDVVFTVKDTGIGVPKSERDNLFSKFFVQPMPKNSDLMGLASVFI